MYYLQNIYLRHLLFTYVNFFVCHMVLHKLWSFSITKDEAALLHTVVTQPLDHGTVFTIPAELDKGDITAAPAPLCQSLFCPPPTLTHLVLVSWVARELARLCTWPVPSSPPTVTDISAAGRANISSGMGDQISSFRFCLHKEALANSVWNWQLRCIDPNVLIKLTSSAQFQISPENYTGYYSRCFLNSN